MKFKHLAVAVGFALGLTACGGGGGGDSTPDTKVGSYDFQVTAIDGYLKNANATAVCGDKTFPVVTNASGVAMFDTNGIASSACSIVITAKDDGSTTDIDTGKKFAKGTLYLLSPVGQSGNLIASPFTTMVALLMESSAGSIDLPGAIQQIAEQFGVDASVVTGDFVAKKDVKAALKATALLPFLPKTAAEFTQAAASASAADALLTKLEKINDAVEAKIAELEGSGEDLSKVYIQVTVDATTGAITTTIVPKGITVPTDATGATGSAGTGGGTGN